jgi:FkbM family methyltransferase
MRLLVKLLELLPIRTRVFIKESINLTLPLQDSGSKIFIHTDTAWELYRLSAFTKEPETVLWLQKNLSNEDVFYDIGANVGAYTLLAATLTKQSVRVYAIEPSPNTYAQLTRNLVLNNVGASVTALCLGLSAETGLKTIWYSDMKPGAAEHRWAKEEKDINSIAQTILVYRLDDLIAQLKLAVPTLMKIDVDGYEWEVLQGAANTLKNKKLRSIIIEMDKDDTAKVVKMEQSLAEQGWQLDQQSKHNVRANYIFYRNPR